MNETDERENEAAEKSGMAADADAEMTAEALYARVFRGSVEKEFPAVWQQLLLLTEKGDIRAVKLYFDLMERLYKTVSKKDGAGARDMEEMAAIRRAVFGGERMAQDYQAASLYKGGLSPVRSGEMVDGDAGDEEDADMDVDA